MVSFPTLLLDGISCVVLQYYINTMVGTQKERSGEMEVELLRRHGAGEDTSTGRKIED